MKVDDMVYWLPKFVVELHKEDGTMYPPNSIYSIICGLQRCLKCSDINIFSDSMFAKFRQLLDAQMKQLKSTGNFEKVSADIITEAMEDKLWELQLLGDHNPQALVNTLFFILVCSLHSEVVRNIGGYALIHVKFSSMSLQLAEAT